MILLALSDKFIGEIDAKSSSKPLLENKAKMTSIPKSAWKQEIFLVFKNPFMYAVAG